VRDPLIGPALSVGAGIWLAGEYQAGVRECVFALAAFALLGWMSSRRGATALVWLNACLACFAAGALRQAAQGSRAVPQLNIDRNESALLEGCVVEPLQRDDERAWFTLELAPGARAKVTAYLEPGDPFPALSYGQRIEVPARVREPKNFANPGSFDNTAYLARRQIYWFATVLKSSVPLLQPGACGERWRGWLFGLRTAAVDRLNLLFGGDRTAQALMAATLIGDDSHVEKAWTEAFRRSGTYHTLVISGLHITTLAAVLFWPLRLFLAGELKAMFASVLLAWLYALVSGATAPVLRAAAGFTLVLIARFFFRRPRVLNLLAAVAIGVLLWDPGQWVEASFQLSFLSVAAIGGLAAPAIEAWVTPLQHAIKRLPVVTDDVRLEPSQAQLRVELRMLAETIALVLHWRERSVIRVIEWIGRAVLTVSELALVSFVMQITLALPMILFFHRFSFTGLTANLVLVPLMSLLVPVGFAALFTGWGWIVSICKLLLSASMAIARWHASLEPSWRVADPPLWLLFALLASLIACVFVNGRWRMLPATSIFLLTILLVAQPWGDNRPKTLELTAIDVGQGDAILLVTPEGRTLLTDAGGLPPTRSGKPAKLDTGEDVVSPYLWRRGIRHIDVVAATHAHNDHVAGLAAVIDNFRPKELWTGANAPPALVAKAKQSGVAWRAMESDAAFDFGGVHFDVLAPPRGYAGESPGNNDSLVMRVAWGSTSFLLTGDVEHLVEEQLVEHQHLLHADVLKVAHHGSKTSSSAEWLDAVKPAFALVSVGLDNRFRHPNPQVLERFEERHVSLWRTDRDGLIRVISDGKRIQVETSHWNGLRAREQVFAPE
jgi:competence protein ComEC